MKISVLGCGWLGLPLAEKLIARGHSVKGSTTGPEKLDMLKEKGIEPYLIGLNPELECEVCDDFWDSDVLFLNVPPGRRRENVVKFHTTQIESVLKKLRDSSVKFVLFAGSTSVYPGEAGIVKEEDAVQGEAARASGEALLRAEEMLRSESSFDTTVIRFGGLYGYDRHPANYLAGKKDVANGKAPINLIHRDDCIEIIIRILVQDVRNEIFNAVSDGHPPRDQFYRAVAEQAGLEPPTFLPDSGKNHKVVSNRKLKNRLGYQFIYPNPMDFDPEEV